MALEKAPERGSRGKTAGTRLVRAKVEAESGEPDVPLPLLLTKTLKGITTPRGEVDLTATPGSTTGN